MRIAVVSPGFPPQLGGVEQVVDHQCRELRRFGHEITVYTHTSTAARQREYMTPDGVRVLRFASVSGSERYPVAPALWRHLARDQSGVDVVHAHSFHAIAAAGAAAVVRSPLVLTPHFHGGGHTKVATLMHIPYRPVASMMFRRARRVVCVSKAEAELLVASFPTVSERITVIPNAIEPLDFTTVDPQPVSRRVILSSGRLEPYKQVDVVLQAVGKADFGCDLVVTGTGTDAGRLSAIATQLSAGDRVRLLGRVSEMELRRWQATADVVVCLSRHEAFGLALIEALAAGARVVASDIAAHREVTSSLDASNLVEFVSVNAGPDTVRAAILRALAMPRPPRRPSVSLPSWRDTVVRLEQLYRSVVAEAA